MRKPQNACDDLWGPRGDHHERQVPENAGGLENLKRRHRCAGAAAVEQRDDDTEHESLVTGLPISYV